MLSTNDLRGLIRSERSDQVLREHRHMFNFSTIRLNQIKGLSKNQNQDSKNLYNAIYNTFLKLDFSAPVIKLFY